MSAKTFSWPGSWPNTGNDRPVEELLALSDEEQITMIRENFAAQWEATDGHIDYLSTGDSGEWSIWILIPTLVRLRAQLKLPPVNVQDYMDMLGAPCSAKDITAEKIGPLGIARLARLAHEEFIDFRAGKGEAGKHLKLRIGVASPFDWAAMTNCYMRHIEGFEQAVINEMTEVLSFAEPQDILFTWESPFGQILAALARPFGLGGVAARYFAGMLERAVQFLPVDAQISLHPCWGDYKNHSMIEVVLKHVADFIAKYAPGGRGPHKLMQRLARWLQSPKAVVVFTNPLQKAAGIRLREVLLCLVAGTAKPSDKAKSYQALQKLLRRPFAKYSAGICHRGMTLEEGVRVRDAAQQGSGITFDSFGPTCGLARVSEEDARAIVKTALYLGGHGVKQ